jgi:hypothetical protein
MPRMNMFISNNNAIPPRNIINTSSTTTTNNVKPSSALNASIIGRIHTTKPGCGSCGRH